jgi:twitching motility two-component system response regulator PilH
MLPNNPAPQPAPTGEGEPPKSGKITVMIVDDHAVVRAGLRLLLDAEDDLEAAGEAGTAREAIFEARALKPDLVLMDVVLPGQNGFQATRTLSRDEATKRIPIILCTSKGQETDKVWGLRQGARDYIVKPINQAELLAKIAALG